MFRSNACTYQLMAYNESLHAIHCNDAVQLKPGGL